MDYLEKQTGKIKEALTFAWLPIKWKLDIEIWTVRNCTIGISLQMEIEILNKVKLEWSLLWTIF